MAIARITIPGGISVEVDGTPEEVAGVLERLETKHGTAGPLTSSQPSGGRGERPSLIQTLKSEEYFKTPRGLSDVQKKLAELGHHYPVTTLSGAMQSQSKNRSLRRFKSGGKYVYVQ